MASSRIINGLACLLIVAGCGQTTVSRPTHESISIQGHSFSLEVADDAEARTKGLMYRESIPIDGGMLFIFPDAATRSFWMKNCLVDMELIFLDPHGRITAKHHMTVESPIQPDETDNAYEVRLRGYPSSLRAQFAIELQSGWLERLNLGVDDKIDLDLARLKARAR